jgi:hypothetical protein
MALEPRIELFKAPRVGLDICRLEVFLK